MTAGRLAKATVFSIFTLSLGLALTGCGSAPKKPEQAVSRAVTPPVKNRKEQIWTRVGIIPDRVPAETKEAEKKAIETILEDDVAAKKAVLKAKGNGASAAPPQKNCVWEVLGSKVDTCNYDMPIVRHPLVVFWMEYFTGKGRKHFERYLERSEHFIPYLIPVLKDHGMPTDLVYLAMIESGFNNHAKSHASAVGAWQFISETGKRYGLTVDYWVDERRDVKKSTIAAIEYLRDLYREMGAWELAMASYNAGENKLRNAIKTYGSNDYWTLIRYPYLKPETKNYVPKMMAAALLAKNREAYGFSPASRNLVKSQATEEQALELAWGTGLDDGSQEEILEKMPIGIAVPHANGSGQVSGEHVTEVTIPGPADLFKVARAAGISFSHLKSLNPELLRWITPANQKKYTLKIPQKVVAQFKETYFHPAFPRTVRFLRVRVSRGDTYYRIARRHGLHPEPVMQLNGQNVSSMHAVLPPLKMVDLPLPSDMAYSLAAAEWSEAIKPSPAVAKQSRSRPVVRRTVMAVSRSRQAASSPGKRAVSVQRAAPAASTSKLSPRKRKSAQSRRPVAEL